MQKIWSIFLKSTVYGFIYFMGYLNVSFAWILFPLIAIGMQNTEKLHRKRDLTRMSAMQGEKESIYAHFNDLPEWVRFPDKEKAEWLNNIFKQIWPKVNHYARDLISGPIEQSLKGSIKGFKFERIVLGNVPFRLGGVVVHEPTSRDQIVMDIDLE